MQDRNIKWLCPVWAQTRDQTRNLGMCPDQESNPQHFDYGATLRPTEPHWPGQLLLLKSIHLASPVAISNHVYSFPLHTLLCHNVLLSASWTECNKKGSTAWESMSHNLVRMNLLHVRALCVSDIRGQGKPFLFPILLFCLRWPRVKSSWKFLPEAGQCYCSHASWWGLKLF